MTKINILSIWAIAMLCGLSLNAQTFKVQEIGQSEARTILQNPDATVLPARYAAFDVDRNELGSFLAEKASDEFTGKSDAIVELPLPDGSRKNFQIWYSTIFEPGLQAKYPEIRSYSGKSLDGEMTLRMTVSQIGVNAAIRTPEGMIYIDPLVEYKGNSHASYYVKDVDTHHHDDFICGTDDHIHNPLEGLNPEDIQGGIELRSAGQPVGIRTFRAAIAATGEWTQREGSKANAVAKVAASVDRANVLFESEIAVRLILVDNNDLVVFDDPGIDPYTGGPIKVGAELISVNTGHLNRIIGEENYDIGHVYTLRCQNVGGIARTSSVCDDDNKGAGTTCWASQNLENSVVRIFCHEVGHQFSARHTFNHCDMENENLPTGYEPGSGSTIMSYAGGCGAQNVQSSEDPYYHANTLQAMFGFSRQITCGAEINTDNIRPDVSFIHEDGFTIPVSTPFYLKGMGSDDNGDDLLFNIEQHDAGIKICNLGNPEGSCPAFRSVIPSEDDYRVFPRFTTIWNNQIASSKNEVLVDYSREFNFVITARDNNSQVGGFGMDTVTFNATADAGPFRVLSPNDGETLSANKYELIEWDVANTDVAPVACRSVNIVLHNSSSDFEDIRVLKMETENDGSEWVLMPNEDIDDVRVAVVAADNIFFDISDRDVTIAPSNDTTYSLGLQSNSARICLPDVFETEVQTSSLGDYQGMITLDIVGGLPSGATYSFDETTIETSNSTNLTIDMTDVTDNGTFTVLLQAIGENGDTLTREITLETVNSDFSELAVVSPEDGEAGVSQSTDLTWVSVGDAESYDIQLATNPSFDGGSIVQEEYNVTSTSISLNDPLEKNTIYFWRLKAKNICGEGTWTVPAAFATEAAVCTDIESPDKQVNVPTGETTSFELDVNLDAEIIDLNISKIDFFCDFLSDAVIRLEHPDGEDVLIANKECGNVTEMNCGFDDDATRAIRCPPNNGQDFQPRGSLSNFNGKNAQGTWKLNIEVARVAVSSELGEWSLEVCTNASAAGPRLVRNDTLKTKPGENNAITSSLLRTEDSNNSASELTYVLSTITSEGDLELNGNVLSPGMSFTQADINNGNFSYAHVGNEDVVDQFVFTVNDGEGGFTGSHTYIIDVNEANPSSNNDVKFERVFEVFPNPTSGVATLVFETELLHSMDYEVINLNGQVIRSGQVDAGSSSYMIDLSGEADGTYIIKAADKTRYYSTKVTVH